MADALSQRGRSSEDPNESENEVDDHFHEKLYSTNVTENPSLTARIYLHEGEYEGDDFIVGQNLKTLQRLDNLTNQK